MNDELTRRTLDLFKDLRGKAHELASRQLIPAGRAILDGGDDRGALTADEKVLADAGRNALVRLADGEQVDALSAEERMGLHFLLLITARPALRVMGRQVVGPFPREWSSKLQASSAVLKPVIDATVRIDRAGIHQGTGFAVGPTTILTNRHVAEQIATQGASQWQLRAEVTVDFDAEGADTKACFKVMRVADVHPSLDVAVLTIDVESPISAPADFVIPDPLLFATDARAAGTSVAVVGCPGKPKKIDGYASDVVWRLFAMTFGVKRVSPGAVRWVEKAAVRLAHDASTLGGSSGSPVVALDDGLVLGVHFGGDQYTQNEAVLPLKNDPFFSEYVTFN